MDDGWSLHEREPQKADALTGAPPARVWDAAPPGPSPGHAAVTLTTDDKNMAMLTHVLAFSGFVVPGLGLVLGPLIMWLAKKDSSPFVDFHGKQAVNFNLSVLVYGAIATVLIWTILGFFVLIAVGIFWFMMTIVQAMKASEGEWSKSPLTIEFLK